MEPEFAVQLTAREAAGDDAMCRRSPTADDGVSLDVAVETRDERSEIVEVHTPFDAVPITEGTTASTDAQRAPSPVHDESAEAVGIGSRGIESRVGDRQAVGTDGELDGFERLDRESEREAQEDERRGDQDRGQTAPERGVCVERVAGAPPRGGDQDGRGREAGENATGQEAADERSAVQRRAASTRGGRLGPAEFVGAHNNGSAPRADRFRATLSG